MDSALSAAARRPWPWGLEAVGPGVMLAPGVGPEGYEGQAGHGEG